MKKIYMTPTTKCVEAQTEEMIAASGLFATDGSGNPTQDLSSAPELNSETTSGNLSRQGLWDDTDF